MSIERKIEIEISSLPPIHLAQVEWLRARVVAAVVCDKKLGVKCLSEVRCWFSQDEGLFRPDEESVLIQVHSLEDRNTRSRLAKTLICTIRDTLSVKAIECHIFPFGFEGNAWLWPSKPDTNTASAA